MVDKIMSLESGTKAFLLAPIVRDRKGEYKKEFLELKKQGFQRVKVDGNFYDLDEPPELDKKYRHDVDVVVDRLVIKEGLETRLADSLRTSLDLADGIAILETLVENGEPLRHTFSENFACPVSGFTIPEIEPRLFSFNAPFGACPDCDGLGAELFFDERLVVPDKELKISDGALAPWRKGKSPYFLQTIEALANHYGFEFSAKWKEIPISVQQVFLYGSGEEEILFRYDEGGRVYQVKRTLRVLFQIWNAVIKKLIAVGYVRNLKVIKTNGRVKRVKVIVSICKHALSRLMSCISEKLWRCQLKTLYTGSQKCKARFHYKNRKSLILF